MKSTRLKTAVLVAAAVFAVSQVALADLQVGQQATLFESIDENMEPSDMADMIDGKPLVLIVSSCT